MERTDRIYKKNNESSIKNSFKVPVLPHPRTRFSGDDKGFQDNRMQRMGTTEDEEEEEEEDDKSSEQHFLNSRLICAACHLTISSTNLGDNNDHYEQALACSQGHLLCHRCVQRFAIQSDMGCLLCVAESQKSPSTCSRSSSSNHSFENVHSRSSSVPQEEHVQPKKTEEIYAIPRTRYPPSLPTASTRRPQFDGLHRTDSRYEWGTEYGDPREDRFGYEIRQCQQKSNCSLIRKDEPEASNSEKRVNGQMVSDCSRRPIRCPRLDCAMTVALSALTHHFLFDHPEVPILSVEPGAKSTLIVSFNALTSGTSKCLALLLVSGKLSGAAANLFNGSQIHAKYRNRLPLPVLAARLKSTNQPGIQNAIKAGGEGQTPGDVIIAWVAGLDFGSSVLRPLRCSLQAVDNIESEGLRSLTYTGPINSLRTAQKPYEVFLSGDCLVLHEGLVNQISSGSASLNVNVIVH
ncbi:uncharacterized protein LOC117174440 isoform X2 [Belonocnema kinseyi]|uniref:uncharacterized protein LOC117174440 isoform X2 n=1 Tax=Belonocnema kinseyi TaxID=2817044 RepID=UPI00143D039C|nr:uncharacterized protein LOC117174440 isoform X2 [Belonocnema kinseyi]